MKPTFVLSCILSLGVAAPIASASPEIPFLHRHKKDSATTAVDSTPKPKTKRNLIHRAQPNREQAARAEATYGMTGPQSVGRLHPEPGPAGVGAK